MPLFEVETTSHIMIACVDDESGARSFAAEHYPSEEVVRVLRGEPPREPRNDPRSGAAVRSKPSEAKP